MALFLLSSSACGSGSGPGGPPPCTAWGGPPQPGQPLCVDTEILPSVLSHSGYFVDLNLADVPSGEPTAGNDGVGIVVGDHALNGQFIGFLRIDMHSLAYVHDYAQVQRAKLRLWQKTPRGNPTSLGRLVVDVMDFGAELDRSDAQLANVIHAAALTIPVQSASGFLEVNVLDIMAVGSQWSPYLDLRLRFETSTNNDDVADTVEFEDAEDHTGGNPYIEARVARSAPR